MDFKKRFSDLASKYNLNYEYQEFERCFMGNWRVFTHSLYNNFGCFTIQHIPQRGEVDCYVAPKFSSNREALCETLVNVYGVEKEIWAQHEKLWIFKNPFFYWNTNKIIATVLEVIEASIEKNNEFFGIEITKN